MLIFLPNMPEDRINRHQKLNTVPCGILLPTPACAKWALAPESWSPGRPAGPGNPAQVVKFGRPSSPCAPPASCPLHFPDTPPLRAGPIKWTEVGSNMGARWGGRERRGQEEKKAASLIRQRRSTWKGEDAFPRPRRPLYRGCSALPAIPAPAPHPVPGPKPVRSPRERPPAGPPFPGAELRGKLPRAPGQTRWTPPRRGPSGAQ